MAELDELAPETVFKANKRRKILRKRTDTGIDEAVIEQLQPEGIANDGVISDQSSSVVRAQKPKKHAVHSSRSTGTWVEEPMQNQEMAIAQRLPEAVQELVGNDRFVKSTGKVAPVEDKHMLAFVDSKLAELRSTTSTPNNAIPGISNGKNAAPFRVNGASDAPGTAGPEDAVEEVSVKGRSQHPADRPKYQRPTRRRPPRERDAKDVARDSMIDQIMRESAIPIYDKTSNAGASRPDADSFDNDAAAAEAFKAEYLASVEEKQRLAGPPKPPAQGPKLGGSRQQRERMKAVEDAKAKK